MSATAEKAAKPKVTIIEAIAKAYHDAFADDPKVITLGEDLADPEGGGIAKITMGLSTSLGDDRVRSTPISQQAIMGAASGSRLAGYKPVADILLTYFTQADMAQSDNHDTAAHRIGACEGRGGSATASHAG